MSGSSRSARSVRDVLLVADVTRIHELTGRSPRIPLDRTLRDLVESLAGAPAI